MSTKRLRTIIASERPEMRRLLAKAFEEERNVAVVGQASNAVEAMAHARRLKPEIAVVDTQLPYFAGLDGTPISRMSGLDAAAHILRELPECTVIAVNCADSRQSGSPDHGAILCRSLEEDAAPISLSELRAAHGQGGRVVFVHSRMGRRQGVRNKAEAVGHRMLLVGGLSVTGGAALIPTVIFAGAGALGIVFGGVSLLGGWMTTFAAKRLPRAPMSLAKQA